MHFTVNKMHTLRANKTIIENKIFTCVAFSVYHKPHPFVKSYAVFFVKNNQSGRMQRAAELLTHTELPVIQVAQSVGYEDPLYFSRVFRQRWGVSPTIYGSRRRTEYRSTDRSDQEI